MFGETPVWDEQVSIAPGFVCTAKPRVVAGKSIGEKPSEKEFRKAYRRCAGSVGRLRQVAEKKIVDVRLDAEMFKTAARCRGEASKNVNETRGGSLERQSSAKEMKHVCKKVDARTTE